MGWEYFICCICYLCVFVKCLSNDKSFISLNDVEHLSEHLKKFELLFLNCNKNKICRKLSITFYVRLR